MCVYNCFKFSRPIVLQKTTVCLVIINSPSQSWWIAAFMFNVDLCRSVRWTFRPCSRSESDASRSTHNATGMYVLRKKRNPVVRRPLFYFSVESWYSCYLSVENGNRSSTNDWLLHAVIDWKRDRVICCAGASRCGIYQQIDMHSFWMISSTTMICMMLLRRWLRLQSPSPVCAVHTLKCTSYSHSKSLLNCSVYTHTSTASCIWSAHRQWWRWWWW